MNTLIDSWQHLYVQTLCLSFVFVSVFQQFVYACVRAFAYVCECMCVRMYVHSNVCVCVYANVFVREYVCFFVHARVCIHHLPFPLKMWCPCDNVTSQWIGPHFGCAFFQRGCEEIICFFQIKMKKYTQVWNPMSLSLYVYACVCVFLSACVRAYLYLCVTSVCLCLYLCLCQFVYVCLICVSVCVAYACMETRRITPSFLYDWYADSTKLCVKLQNDSTNCHTQRLCLAVHIYSQVFYLMFSI